MQIFSLNKDSRKAEKKRKAKSKPIKDVVRPAEPSRLQDLGIPPFLRPPTWLLQMEQCL